ncbi:ZN282 protein, partial [Podilymbus podiceps]|nr:ZN282 protein [Podilymbus podiceps]
SSISLWTVVAAVQAVERSVDAHASRLLSLERRTGSAEKKSVECEKMVAEFGNQLESKCAALGTLLREYRRLLRRLETVENLLKSRSSRELRLPAGDERPEAPAVFESDAACFPAEEWENGEEWQRELYRTVPRGRNDSLIPLGKDQQGAGRVPSAELSGAVRTSSFLFAPAGYGVQEPSFAGVVKQEEELCAEERGAAEVAEFTELSVEDSIILIKQEEELCTADQQEGEAGEDPEEPCPGE